MSLKHKFLSTLIANVITFDVIHSKIFKILCSKSSLLDLSKFRGAWFLWCHFHASFLGFWNRHRCVVGQILVCFKSIKTSETSMIYNQNIKSGLLNLLGVFKSSNIYLYPNEPWVSCHPWKTSSIFCKKYVYHLDAIVNATMKLD